MQALRRGVLAADTFPEDVLELQGYLTGQSRIAGVKATPGQGTNVPLYILGSSLFGAQLAAALGLPYGFASHFAPQALHQAVAIYRRDFRPSEQLSEPYVIAGVNVLAADTQEEADEQFLRVRRSRVGIILGRDRQFSDEEADAILASPQGRQVEHMTHYSAVGTPEVVRDYLADFAVEADADELMVVHSSPSVEQRLRSIDLLAEAWDLSAEPARSA